MGLLEEQLRGESLADYTNEQLRISLNTALYTNTADMWKRYLEQQGYSGSVADMMAKWWAANNVPPQFRNYINSGLYLFNPRQFFQDGSIGVLYDNNDLTSFYLDVAGTTPATVNGLVGLQLDKSQGLALGAELVTNGDFSAGSTGWTFGGGGGMSISGGTANYDASFGSGSLRQSFSSAGWHQVSFTVSGISSGQARIILFTNNTGTTLWSNTAVQNGTYTFLIFTPITTNIDLNFYNTDGGSPRVSCSIDNFSIKQLPGNHRYQATTGSKPVLRGTPTGGNLVANPTFATDTWWGKDPGIAITGGKAVFTTTTNFFTLYTPASTISTGNVYRVRFTIDSISAGGIRVDVGSSVSATYTSAGTYEVYLTASGAGTQMSLRTIGTTTATIDNVELFDVSAGSVTAPYGLQHDGVDDFLQTASVNFTATDKMFVCAGVRKLSDAAQTIFAELSADINTNNGSFTITANRTTADDRPAFLSKGTIARESTSSANYPSPVSMVLTGIGDISGDSAVLRIGGAQVGSAVTDQGTGNYGNFAIYFGRRGGTTRPYNGLDFGFVIVGKTLTAAQISSTERWMAQRTGVSI